MDVTHGAWASLPKYMVSLLKAWYGDGATAAISLATNGCPSWTKTCPR